MLRSWMTLLLLSPLLSAQEGSGQEDKILERGEKLLEQAKAAYEDARAKSSVPGFIDAGFKLEEARIKFIVLQEIGTPERQKLAADRLRAINQLGKLIHDGKVAISGTPGEPKPPDPGTPDPVPKTPEEPVKSAADVTKRAAAPDPIRQRDAEKLVKDLFKDLYAKRAPADRLALAEALLGQAAKSADDPAILWVLFREAQEAAVQACDLQVAFKAVEASARVFDVDGLALRNGAPQGALKLAKNPAECLAVGSATLRLADDLIAADQYEAADKATTAALPVARRGNDPALVAKLAQRNKEIAEAKSRYQALKSVLETLAKNPEDPAANNEMGQFLCFVKNNWDLGARFLLKGSDPALKSLAEKEVAMPTQALDQVALADGWWELSEREKSPLRKSQMQSHAKLLYEGALPSLSGLVLVKVERRLAETGSTGAGPSLDLLALIDPKHDAVFGDWILERPAVVSNSLVPSAKLQIPYLAPEEYDLTVVCERLEGGDAFGVGLASSSFQTAMIFDGYSGGGGIAGFEILDGKNADANDSTRRGMLFANHRPSTIVCSVRKTGITVTVDGKKVVDYRGDLKRLTVRGDYVVPNPRAFFLVTWGSKYSISKIQLTTLSGQGRRLR